MEKPPSQTPSSKKQDSGQSQPPSDQIVNETATTAAKKQQQPAGRATGCWSDPDQSAAREVVEPGEHGEVGVAATSAVAITTQAFVEPNAVEQLENPDLSEEPISVRVADAGSARKGRGWTGRRKIRIARVRNEGVGIAGYPARRRPDRRGIGIEGIWVAGRVARDWRQVRSVRHRIQRKGRAGRIEFQRGERVGQIRLFRFGIERPR